MTQERARINSNATRALAATATSTTSPTDVMNKTYPLHMQDDSAHIANETPAPTNRIGMHSENNVRINNTTATPKHVQFGTVDAAEFDLERPAVEFTPLSSEVTQAKYSIEKKVQQAVQAEVEDEETNEETKQNSATLAQWEDAFDELDNDNDFGSRTNKRQSTSSSARRNNRRSSTFFSKRNENLIAEDDEDLEENDENKTLTNSASPNSSPSDFLETSGSSISEETLIFSEELQTSPIESTITHNILSALLPSNLNEYSSPLLLHHRDSSMLCSNSSSDHALASLRSLHSSGALLSPNASSLSDVSTEEIHDIRVSLEKNLDNAFDNSNSSSAIHSSNNDRQGTSVVENEV